MTARAEPPAPADPRAFPVDEAAYRAGPHHWLDELDDRTVGPGPPYHRMGTAAIAGTAWLPADEHRDRELALRRRLVAEARDEVFAALPGSRAACNEAGTLVHTWLATHRPAHGVPPPPDGVDETEPLVRAGLAVQDDLAVMVRTGGQWQLGAALVCFPTFWRLADKIGRTQQEVHGPVPRYDGELASRVSTFFDRLAPGRIVARRNWGFAPSPLLFVPDLAALGDPGPFDPARWWLRSERQTLRRLPDTGAVLFTIRVQLAPVDALADRPELCDRLAAAMASWPPDLVAGRSGGHAWHTEAGRWLRARAAVASHPDEAARPPSPPPPERAP
jgi:hypothetical protein